MKLEDIKIKDYGMISHMSMEKKHIAKYSGIFECEGLSLHNKTFYKEVYTKVKKDGTFGKSKQIFYDDELNSPIFTTLKELIKHYENGIE